MRIASLALLALLFSPANARAQAPSSPASEEIVVTAQRTGAPVWRVRSATGTLVLVGSIDNVAAGTDWRPATLAATVGKANRVMFPQMMAVSVSPFALIGYLAKWKRRARLPAGQTLSGMMSPADGQRLTRLAQQGMIPADYNRWHPLHLAFNMQDRLRKRTGLMEAPTTTVARAAGKYKVARVPIQRTSARPLTDSLFQSRPADHLPCLMATIGAMEFGPEGVRARSRDWAAKRIQAALAAPSQRLGSACWPTNTNPLDANYLANTARRTLGTAGTTLAVVNLEALARSGGLLDTLKGAGFEVTGPAWRYTGDPAGPVPRVPSW